MKSVEQRNEFENMKTISKVLCLCCVCLSQQLIHAASPAGCVIGWGDNINGKATSVPSYPLSNGTVVVTGNPFATGAVSIATQPLANAVAIAAGRLHSLALRTDGTVAGWGENGRGEVLGDKTPYPFRTNGVARVDGKILRDIKAVAAGDGFSLGLKRDGTIVEWGENAVAVTVSNVVAIAAAGFASVVVRSDGTVVEWNNEKANAEYGQVHAVPGLSNVTAVAAGESAQGARKVALRSDGTVANWGVESIDKDATPPAGLSNVVAIAAGDAHTLALRKDGAVIGWGYNNAGQATGTPTPDYPSFSAGPVQIGGQPLSNIKAVAAGHGYSMALRNDGTVVAWGRIQNSLYPATAPVGLSGVVAIAAGDDFSLAVTTNTAVSDRFRQTK